MMMMKSRGTTLLDLRRVGRLSIFFVVLLLFGKSPSGLLCHAAAASWQLPKFFSNARSGSNKTPSRMPHDKPSFPFQWNPNVFDKKNAQNFRFFDRKPAPPRTIPSSMLQLFEHTAFSLESDPLAADSPRNEATNDAPDDAEGGGSSAPSRKNHHESKPMPPPNHHQPKLKKRFDPYAVWSAADRREMNNEGGDTVGLDKSHSNGLDLDHNKDDTAAAARDESKHDPRLYNRNCMLLPQDEDDDPLLMSSSSSLVLGDDDNFLPIPPRSRPSMQLFDQVVILGPGMVQPHDNGLCDEEDDDECWMEIVDEQIAGLRESVVAISREKKGSSLSSTTKTEVDDARNGSSQRVPQEEEKRNGVSLPATSLNGETKRDVTLGDARNGSSQRIQQKEKKNGVSLPSTLLNGEAKREVTLGDATNGSSQREPQNENKSGVSSPATMLNGETKKEVTLGDAKNGSSQRTPQKEEKKNGISSPATLLNGETKREVTLGDAKNGSSQRIPQNEKTNGASLPVTLLNGQTKSEKRNGSAENKPKNEKDEVGTEEFAMAAATAPKAHAMAGGSAPAQEAAAAFSYSPNASWMASSTTARKPGATKQPGSWNTMGRSAASSFPATSSFDTRVTSGGGSYLDAIGGGSNGSNLGKTTSSAPKTSSPFTAGAPAKGSPWSPRSSWQTSSTSSSKTNGVGSPFQPGVPSATRTSSPSSMASAPATASFKSGATAASAFGGGSSASSATSSSWPPKTTMQSAFSTAGAGSPFRPPGIHPKTKNKMSSPSSTAGAPAKPGATAASAFGGGPSASSPISSWPMKSSSGQKAATTVGRGSPFRPPGAPPMTTNKLSSPSSTAFAPATASAKSVSRATPAASAFGVAGSNSTAPTRGSPRAPAVGASSPFKPRGTGGAGSPFKPNGMVGFGAPFKPSGQVGAGSPFKPGTPAPRTAGPPVAFAKSSAGARAASKSGGGSSASPAKRTATVGFGAPFNPSGMGVGSPFQAGRQSGTKASSPSSTADDPGASAKAPTEVGTPAASGGGSDAAPAKEVPPASVKSSLNGTTASVPEGSNSSAGGVSSASKPPWWAPWQTPAASTDAKDSPSVETSVASAMSAKSSSRSESESTTKNKNSSDIDGSDGQTIGGTRSAAGPANTSSDTPSSPKAPATSARTDDSPSAGKPETIRTSPSITKDVPPSSAKSSSSGAAASVPEGGSSSSAGEVSSAAKPRPWWAPWQAPEASTNAEDSPSAETLVASAVSTKSSSGSKSEPTTSNKSSSGIDGSDGQTIGGMGSAAGPVNASSDAPRSPKAPATSARTDDSPSAGKPETIRTSPSIAKDVPPSSAKPSSSATGTLVPEGSDSSAEGVSSAANPPWWAPKSTWQTPEASTNAKDSPSGETFVASAVSAKSSSGSKSESTTNNKNSSGIDVSDGQTIGGTGSAAGPVNASSDAPRSPKAPATSARSDDSPSAGKPETIRTSPSIEKDVPPSSAKSSSRATGTLVPEGSGSYLQMVSGGRSEPAKPSPWAPKSPWKAPPVSPSGTVSDGSFDQAGASSGSPLKEVLAASAAEGRSSSSKSSGRKPVAGNEASGSHTDVTASPLTDVNLEERMRRLERRTSSLSAKKTTDGSSGANGKPGKPVGAKFSSSGSDAPPAPSAPSSRETAASGGSSSYVKATGEVSSAAEPSEWAPKSTRQESAASTSGKDTPSVETSPASAVSTKSSPRAKPTAATSGKSESDTSGTHGQALGRTAGPVKASSYAPKSLKTPEVTASAGGSPSAGQPKTSVTSVSKPKAVPPASANSASGVRPASTKSSSGVASESVSEGGDSFETVARVPSAPAKASRPAPKSSRQASSASSSGTTGSRFQPGAPAATSMSSPSSTVVAPATSVKSSPGAVAASTSGRREASAAPARGSSSAPKSAWHTVAGAPSVTKTSSPSSTAGTPATAATSPAGARAAAAFGSNAVPHNGSPRIQKSSQQQASSVGAGPSPPAPVASAKSLPRATAVVASGGEKSSAAPAKDPSPAPKSSRRTNSTSWNNTDGSSSPLQPGATVTKTSSPLSAVGASASASTMSSSGATAFSPSGRSSSSSSARGLSGAPMSPGQTSSTTPGGTVGADSPFRPRAPAVTTTSSPSSTPAVPTKSSSGATTDSRLGRGSSSPPEKGVSGTPKPLQSSSTSSSGTVRAGPPPQHKAAGVTKVSSPSSTAAAPWASAKSSPGATSASAFVGGGKSNVAPTKGSSSAPKSPSDATGVGSPFPGVAAVPKSSSAGTMTGAPATSSNSSSAATAPSTFGRESTAASAKVASRVPKSSRQMNSTSSSGKMGAGSPLQPGAPPPSMTGAPATFANSSSVATVPSAFGGGSSTAPAKSESRAAKSSRQTNSTSSSGMNGASSPFQTRVSRSSPVVASTTSVRSSSGASAVLSSGSRGSYLDAVGGGSPGTGGNASPRAPKSSSKTTSSSGMMGTGSPYQPAGATSEFSSETKEGPPSSVRSSSRTTPSSTPDDSRRSLSRDSNTTAEMSISPRVSRRTPPEAASRTDDKQFFSPKVSWLQSASSPVGGSDQGKISAASPSNTETSPALASSPSAATSLSSSVALGGESSASATITPKASREKTVSSSKMTNSLHSGGLRTAAPSPSKNEAPAFPAASSSRRTQKTAMVSPPKNGVTGVPAASSSGEALNQTSVPSPRMNEASVVSAASSSRATAPETAVTSASNPSDMDRTASAESRPSLEERIGHLEQEVVHWKKATRLIEAAVRKNEAARKNEEVTEGGELGREGTFWKGINQKEGPNLNGEKLENEVKFWKEVHRDLKLDLKKAFEDLKEAKAGGDFVKLRKKIESLADELDRSRSSEPSETASGQSPRSSKPLETASGQNPRITGRKQASHRKSPPSPPSSPRNQERTCGGIYSTYSSGTSNQQAVPSGLKEHIRNLQKEVEHWKKASEILKGASETTKATKGNPRLHGEQLESEIKFWDEINRNLRKEVKKAQDDLTVAREKAKASLSEKDSRLKFVGHDYVIFEKKTEALADQLHGGRPSEQIPKPPVNAGRGVAPLKTETNSPSSARVSPRTCAAVYSPYSRETNPETVPSHLKSRVIEIEKEVRHWKRASEILGKASGGTEDNPRLRGEQFEIEVQFWNELKENLKEELNRVWEELESAKETAKADLKIKDPKLQFVGHDYISFEKKIADLANVLNTANLSDDVDLDERTQAKEEKQEPLRGMSTGSPIPPGETPEASAGINRSYPGDLDKQAVAMVPSSFKERISLLEEDVEQWRKASKILGETEGTLRGNQFASEVRFWNGVSRDLREELREAQEELRFHGREFLILDRKISDLIDQLDATLLTEDVEHVEQAPRVEKVKQRVATRYVQQEMPDLNHPPADLKARLQLELKIAQQELQKARGDLF